MIVTVVHIDILHNRKFFPKCTIMYYNGKEEEKERKEKGVGKTTNKQNMTLHPLLKTIEVTSLSHYSLSHRGFRLKLYN